MNKSVYENCISKRIVVSLEKNPGKVDFFKPDYQNIPLKRPKEASSAVHSISRTKWSRSEGPEGKLQGAHYFEVHRVVAGQLFS